MAQIATFESTNTARQKLAELTAQYRNLEKAMVDLATDALKEVCQEVFAKFPEVEQFYWVQYGGEYNDEGAHHGINSIGINDDRDKDEYWWGDWSASAPRDQIQKMIQELGEEVLLMALGTYNEITVTKKDISSDHWEGY